MHLLKKIVKLSLCVMGGAFFAFNAYCQTPVFTIQQNTKVVQTQMVAGSTQNLVYTIVVPSPPIVPPGTPVTITCKMTASNSQYINIPTFAAANGCVGGAEITSLTGNLLVNLALVATKEAAGQSGTITVEFKQTGGRGKGQNPVTITIPITVAASSNRTVSFKNTCPFPVWFGVSSSSIPSKTNANHQCTTDTDCNAVAAGSMCVNHVCGGGWCQTPSDCLVTTNPNPTPTANDPSVCNGGNCSYCTQDSDCVGGGTSSACNSANYQCYWKTPAPTDASTNYYKLGVSGTPQDTDSILLTDNSATIGYSLVWSGGFAGRTQCGATPPYTDANSCKTAGCNTTGIGDNNGGCQLAEGFALPSTQSEITMVANAPDTYDTTIINGTNVPMSIYPNNTATPQAYNNPYNCGNAGGNVATVMNPASTATTLGGCSWDFILPNIAYRWVDTDAPSPTVGTNVCSTDNDCVTLYPDALQYRCGLTLTAVGTTPSAGSGVTVCGTPLGYWNQNEICATNLSYNPTDVPGVVNCTANNYNSGGNTLINLLACTGSNAGTSCYTAGANSACCGCTNWSMLTPGSVPSNQSYVAQCTTAMANTDWTGNVLQPLEFFKQACPSAYVYPFDDKSSTFTCPENGGQSAVNYTVEFCPGGETGGIPALEPA